MANPHPEAGPGVPTSQSAFVRGFIDGAAASSAESRSITSQSAFVRGFIDGLGAQGRDPRPCPSQSAFVRGFIDGCWSRAVRSSTRARLNPRSCAASSMASHSVPQRLHPHRSLNPRSCAASSMAGGTVRFPLSARWSQSAFVRGFIDGFNMVVPTTMGRCGLNPRSCAASSMAQATETLGVVHRGLNPRSCAASSMAGRRFSRLRRRRGLNPRSCAASSMASLKVCRTSPNWSLNPRSCAASSMAGGRGRDHVRTFGVSIRVRARLHRWLPSVVAARLSARLSQSAFVRGFIDGSLSPDLLAALAKASQSAFVRGFIDGNSRSWSSASSRDVSIRVRARLHRWPEDEGARLLMMDKSQSAFVRGFIDGSAKLMNKSIELNGLNPRSCAASSMALGLA